MSNVQSKSGAEVEKGADYYDSFYEAAEAGDVNYYEKPYWKSHYYPLYKAALSEVKRAGCDSVLEVGCGSGAFAHLLFDKSDIEYRGFDFSKNAIDAARRRTGKVDKFFVGDAMASGNEPSANDAIVCLEVLEHIEKDREVVQNWGSGIKCIGSVPNFDSPDHVRVFKNEDQVRERYGDLIAFDRVYTVPRALVRGRGWREYFRQLRWSRNEPRKLMGMLGYKTFQNLAGWVVFSGVRR